MAGVDVGGGGGGKRKVDQEINMIPFIDLLMVTISFLLITAVWSSMARLTASAEVKSPGGKDPKVQKEEPWVLHVRASQKDQKFHLQWQHGNKTEDISSVDMIRDAAGRYRVLEDELKKIYAVGLSTRHLHGDDLGHSSSELDGLAANQAILHVDNGVPFGEITKVIDAVSAPRRNVCFEARPMCCGKATQSGASTEGCRMAASDVPAFAVTFSAS